MMMASVSAIVNNVKEYVGLYQAKPNEYESLLTSVMEGRTPEVLLNQEQLAAALRETGATELQVSKVLLITQVNGFQQLVERDGRTQQADPERFLQNALRQTGFSRPQVLELTAALGAALGIPYGESGSEVGGQAAFVVPYSQYEGELVKIAQAVDAGPLPKTELARLETLTRAGLPRAKYYLGRCLVNEKSSQSSVLLGVRYLEEAAAEGDALAAADLGDYFYQQGGSEGWSKAFSYYTGYGALALSKDRRKKLADILNYRQFNWNIIKSSLLLLAVMTVLSFAAPGAALFGTQRVGAAICLVLQLGLVVLVWLHHRRKPYDSVLWLPLGLFALWCFFTLLRIIL